MRNLSIIQKIFNCYKYITRKIVTLHGISWSAYTRSMSKKGCSPDNSACEGFFGRMKNEMFYGEKWDKISVEEFISIINQYMQWYRDKRIKLSLGGLSPMEYRRSLGIA